MLDRKVTIKKGGSFDPVPADKYTVQIGDVNLVTRSFKGKESEKLNYRYIILDEKPMPEGSDEESTRGKYLWHAVSEVLNERSWLQKLATAAYGHSLSQEEIDNFDPEALVGMQVDVMVNQTESNGIVYNNIVGYSKTLKKLKEAEDPTVVKESKSSVVESKSQPVALPQEVENASSFDKFLNTPSEEEMSEEELEAKLKEMKSAKKVKK